MISDIRITAKVRERKNSPLIRSEESLLELVSSNEFDIYVDLIEDDDYENVRWSVLGDHRNNLIWIVLDVGNEDEPQVVECIKSRALLPLNQLEAIDLNDAQAVLMHVVEMRARHKDKLPR